VLHALIVGTVAAAVLIGSAHALADVPPAPESSVKVAERTETKVAAGERTETGPQRPVLYATVVKPFGASVRTAQSSEAPVAFNSRCGDVWPVVAVQAGWVKVRANGATGWIGGGRVVVSSTPPSVDCSGGRFLAPTGTVTTKAATGCLTLHVRPSRDADSLACVENGHEYAVVDGPFDPGTGEDWFKVTSPTTGTGWALAGHLYPD
jgi:hypothetical protein